MAQEEEMTEAQASATLVAHKARYVTVKGAVQWWRAADGKWIAKTADRRGEVTLRMLPADACGC